MDKSFDICSMFSKRSTPIQYPINQLAINQVAILAITAHLDLCCTHFHMSFTYTRGNQTLINPGFYKHKLNEFTSMFAKD